MSSPVALSVAQRVLDEFAVQILDDSLHCDLFTLRRGLKSAQEALPDAPPELRGPMYRFVGSVHRRLGQHALALNAFKNAMRVEPNEPVNINNVACGLLELQRNEEALEFLRAHPMKLDRLPICVAVCLLGNEAEGLHRLGQVERAREVFESAVRLARPTSPSSWFHLAQQAAVLGAEDDAVEFFARYLAAVTGTELGEESALEFIQRAPVEYRVRAAEIPEFAAALLRAQGREEAPPPPDQQVNPHIVLSDGAWNTFVHLAEPDAHGA